MIGGQFSRVTGRRFRQPNEALAKLPFLKQLEAEQERRRNEAYRRKMVKKEIDLKKDKLEEDKKTQTLANIFGGVKALTDVGTGIYNAFSGDIDEPEKPAVTEEKTLEPTTTDETLAEPKGSGFEFDSKDFGDINNFLYKDQLSGDSKSSDDNDFGGSLWDSSLSF